MTRRSRLLIGLAVVLVASLTVGLASAAPAAQQCGGYYTVQYGDGLYRISLWYGVSQAAIANANNIYNYDRIYAGQQLYIPCGNTSYQAHPVYTQPQHQYYNAQQYDPWHGRWRPNYNGVVPPTYYPGTNPQTVYVPPGYNPSIPSGYVPYGGTCAGMVPTSPLDGMAHGGNTFYWNPTSGVNGYRVNVYTVDVNPGALIATFYSAGTQTNLNGDVGGAPGYRLAWEVQGLINGNVVCTSQRYTVNHAVS